MLIFFFAQADSNCKPIRDLIAQLVQDPRDDQAWEEFFQRFDKTIYRIIRAAYHKYLGPDSGVEVPDFVQQLYQRLLENRGRALLNFRGATDGEFQAYLMCIGYNLVHDHCLQNRKQISRSFEDEPSSEGSNEAAPPSVPPTQEQAVRRDELRALIANSLGQAGGGQRMHRNCLIFILRYYHQYTTKEVAEALKISPESVDIICYRMKQKVMSDLVKVLKEQPNKFDDLL